jgi:3-phenylpropionate/trans-cinnamate dioxygenase ferredoxin reductase subunit
VSAGTLIVGASQAGLQVAATMRELGVDTPIRLVGSESRLPYQRPPLSKAFLLGDSSPDTLAFRNLAFFSEREIDLSLSTSICEITFAGGRGLARSSRGEEIPFENLALTTGAAPRRLRVPGADLAGVLYLRDVEDSLALRQAYSLAADVVIVGGGFIGLEAAAVSRQNGMRVTVVEAESGLLPRVAAPVMAEFYQHAHERRGVTFRLGAAIAGILGTGGRVSGVALSDGSILQADLLLVAIGVEPRTELAEQLGAACAGGIVVDRFAQTSIENVVAAGDCAVGPSPTGTGEMIRLESVQNAVDQAKVAGATLARLEHPYTAVPWFWSDQGDIKLHMAGLSAGYDHYVVRGDPETEKFSVLYYRDGKFLAISCVNRAADYLAARGALERGQHLPPGGVADESVPLRQLLADSPAVQPG